MRHWVALSLVDEIKLLQKVNWALLVACERRVQAWGRRRCRKNAKCVLPLRPIKRSVDSGISEGFCGEEWSAGDGGEHADGH